MSSDWRGAALAALDRPVALDLTGPRDAGWESGQLWMVRSIGRPMGRTALALHELPVEALAIRPGDGEDDISWRDGWYQGVMDVLIERKWVAMPPTEGG
jgi:hypothetical protein